jgi:uncharacterized membrane protein YgcG
MKQVPMPGHAIRSRPPLRKRHGWLWIAAAAALLLGVFQVARAAAPQAERILSFDSRIAIQPDAGMLVTETIKVLSTGERIRRGIFRDFPTTYKDPAGNRYAVGFTVEEITRDGRPEAWHTEAQPNGVRIYMGRKEQLLPPGEHTYTLTYRTDRQLGFFKDHDELYWNVTGNGWNFGIDRASASVALPPGVSGPTLLEAYTGPAGAKGRAYHADSSREGSALFRTTRGLAPYEGLTIVVGWPKGFVREPSSREKALYFFKDHLTLLAAVVGIAVLLAYYVLVWFAVGRDPEKGTVVPLYTPPAGMSPAAMRFITEMGYDDKVFAAAVIDMAVKGHLGISESNGSWTLEKKDGAGAKLSPDEQTISAHLFRSGKTIVLQRANHARIGAAKNAFKAALALAYEKTHFVNHRRAFLTGVVISVATVAVSFLSSLHRGEVVFLGLWLSIWSIGVLFLGAMVVKLWGLAFTGTHSLGARVRSSGAALFMTLFALPFFGGEIFALYTLAQDSPALAALPIVAAGVNVVFYHLLKAPTALGRRTLDQIEGFKMFLAATEADRLQRMHPAGRTPELYERFLPYALALNVEPQWTEQFSDVLSAAAQPGGRGAYHPRWYSGSGWDRSRMSGFAASVGSSLSGAISASSSAPGSRSGGGGGGSSGGGGGGGGGGSW